MFSFLLAFLTVIRVLVRSRADTALEVLALRQQLGVLKRKRPRPRLGAPDRLFWSCCSSSGPAGPKTASRYEAELLIVTNLPLSPTITRLAISSSKGYAAIRFAGLKDVAHWGNSLHSFLPDIGPLRLREFLLIYIGQFVSSFGSAMTYVVLPFQMYALTRSTLAVGLIGVVEFASMVAMALIGGALADHFDRRRLIGSVESAMTLCCAVLAWNASLLAPHVVVLWIIAGLLAGLGALHRPAMEALMQQVLPVSEMMAALALNSVRGNFAFIVGPGLAGIIAATGGATAAFAVDGFSYVVSIAMIVMMRPVARMTLGEKGITWRALLDGWRYARGRQDLLGTYLIDINATFFGMPNALFPAMAEQWGAVSVGLLYAAPSLGAMMAALTSRWASGVHRHGLAITWAAVLWGIAIAAFGFARSLWLALVFLAAAGAADMVSGIFRMAVWNQTIPASIRGRTAAIEMVSYHTGPSLGNAEAGLVARLFGVRTSIVSGGVLCVIGSLALTMILPKFIAYDSTEGVRRRGLDEALFERAKDVGTK